MFLKKLNVLLFLVLNLSITTGLRFFQSRKRKKKCLVREQWNFHYVTCTSKYQRCCATGCCDSAINNPTTAYVKVIIVCSVIILAFTMVYVEIWCKKKCKGLKKKCRSCVTSKDGVDLRACEENCQEIEMLDVGRIESGSESDKQ